MKYISESEWLDLLLEAGLNTEHIDLIYESRIDPYRRVYKENNLCYKIVVSGEVSTSLRTNSLDQEYLILKKCVNIQGIPKSLKYNESNNTQLLTSQYVPGDSLDKLDLDNVELWPLIKSLAIINYRLAMLGISHDDLSASNILLDEEGVIHLVDFDQAKVLRPFVAFFRSFFGIRLGGLPYCKTMPSILLYLFKSKLSVMNDRLVLLRNIFTRLKQRVFGTWWPVSSTHRLPALKVDASDSVKVMFVAWQLAQTSNASAPGYLHAYYELEFEGYLFPGERSWMERWNVLRSITDFSRKRILELGCNMGLLTTYLIKYEGVKEALAVDVDENIIESAELINKAIQVKVEHSVVNFDSNTAWEDRLIGYKPDIVFALNVLNWVEDKSRLIKFLGVFDKLVFEGHDSLEVERNRLLQVGYKKISVITVTERNRAVLFCEK